MHLLDDLINQIKIFAETSEGKASVFLKLFSQLFEIDVHALVRQSNLVHHCLADLEDAFGANHSVDFVIVELEFVVCKFVKLHLLGEICNGNPLQKSLLVELSGTRVLIIVVRELLWIVRQTSFIWFSIHYSYFTLLRSLFLDFYTRLVAFVPPCLL